jgi:hypothetical protein
VKQSGEIHLVLDCDHDKIKMVMKEAQAVGMMTAYHNYLITNMVRYDEENRNWKTEMEKLISGYSSSRS